MGRVLEEPAVQSITASAADHQSVGETWSPEEEPGKLEQGEKLSGD